MCFDGSCFGCNCFELVRSVPLRRELKTTGYIFVIMWFAMCMHFDSYTKADRLLLSVSYEPLLLDISALSNYLSSFFRCAAINSVLAS